MPSIALLTLLYKKYGNNFTVLSVDTGFSSASSKRFIQMGCSWAADLGFHIQVLPAKENFEYLELIFIMVPDTSSPGIWLAPFGGGYLPSL